MKIILFCLSYEDHPIGLGDSTQSQWWHGSFRAKTFTQNVLRNKCVMILYTVIYDLNRFVYLSIALGLSITVFCLQTTVRTQSLTIQSQCFWLPHQIVQCTRKIRTRLLRRTHKLEPNFSRATEKKIGSYLAIALIDKRGSVAHLCHIFERAPTSHMQSMCNAYDEKIERSRLNLLSSRFVYNSFVGLLNVVYEIIWH